MYERGFAIDLPHCGRIGILNLDVLCFHWDAHIYNAYMRMKICRWQMKSKAAHYMRD